MSIAHHVIHLCSCMQSNLRTFLEKMLPDDVHERCTNKAYVRLPGVLPSTALVSSMVTPNVSHSCVVLGADLSHKGIPTPKKYAPL